MTSLVPGAIFQTTGFNRNSTPTPPNITPSQLDNRYSRGDFDGRPWPADSPVSRMYDVKNTSTKMIILNNRFGKSGTRLRGYYSGPTKPERSIDPNRHRAQSPRNPDHHLACYDSSSPKFEPTIKVHLDWSSSIERPENALTAGKSSVNPLRHTSCQTPRETVRFPSEEKQRIPIPPARFFSAKEFSDMSLGEKIYMWSIERIYNVENLKRLKQDQYKKLLQLEAKKGYHGFQQYQKYMRYINSASSRSYGTGSPRPLHTPPASRSRSAFSRHSPTSPSKADTKQSDGARSKEENNEEEQSRPKTVMGITRPDSPVRKDTDTSASEKSAEQRPQSVQSKSPAPSRKSSARSTRSVASTRSIKSRSSVRPPSTTSSKHSENLPKPDQSDSSLSVDGETESKHKEGRDRPKSRLGHMSAEDKDKGPVHSSLSSLSSIPSDKQSSGEDSGLERDKKHSRKQRTSSASSRGSRVTGSNISLGSRKSDSQRPMMGRAKTAKSSTQNAGGSQENQGAKDKDTKIHNVPIGSFEKEETNEVEMKKDTKPDEHKYEEQIKAEEFINAKQTDSESKLEKQDKEEPKFKGEEEKAVSDNNIPKRSTPPQELKINGQSSVADQAVSATEKDQVGSEEANSPVEEKGQASDDEKPIVEDKKPGDVGEKSAQNEDKLVERQDSLEEVDEDRRVNKDLDKIEY